MDFLKNCCCCAYWNQRQHPVFDYDEVDDDLEFENLLEQPGQIPVPQNQQQNVWTGLASLFRFNPKSNGYQGVPTYEQNDILLDQVSNIDAELLTPSQISHKIDSSMIPKDQEQMTAQNYKPPNVIKTNQAELIQLDSEIESSGGDNQSGSRKQANRTKKAKGKAKGKGKAKH